MCSSTASVPIDATSSSATAVTTTSPRKSKATARAAASRIAATAAFMSYAPRPYMRPPSSRGSKGDSMPATPAVSRCPFSSSDRPPPVPRAIAITLGPSPGPTSSTSSPRSRAQRATKSAISRSPRPPAISSGLIESIRTSCCASSANSSVLRTEDPRCEHGGVPRVVHADGRDGDAGRHLRDREQGVEAVEHRERRPERNADHRQVAVRRGHAREGGGQARAADQHAQAASARAAAVLGDGLRLPVCRPHVELVRDATLVELVERALHPLAIGVRARSEEHTSELQSHSDLVCRLLLEKKQNTTPLPSGHEMQAHIHSRIVQ